MKLGLATILLLIILHGNLLAQSESTPSAIDDILVKQADITGDGQPEKIVLHLQAKDIMAPFSWTLTVSSKGKTIYSYTSDDTWLNKFFSDDGYVSDCKDYTSCKRKYYYNDILNSIVVTGSESYDIESVLDESQSNTLYPLGRKQLQESCNISGSQADTILGKIATNLRTGKAAILNIPKSPVQSNPPLIFVPEVGDFVRFYEE